MAAPAKVAPASAATPRPGVTPHPGVVSTPARCAETNFPAGINLGQWRPPSQRPQCTLLAETLVTIPVVTAMEWGNIESVIFKIPQGSVGMRLTNGNISRGNKVTFNLW